MLFIVLQSLDNELSFVGAGNSSALSTSSGLQTEISCSLLVPYLMQNRELLNLQMTFQPLYFDQLMQKHPGKAQRISVMGLILILHYMNSEISCLHHLNAVAYDLHHTARMPHDTCLTLESFMLKFCLGDRVLFFACKILKQNMKGSRPCLMSCGFFLSLRVAHNLCSVCLEIVHAMLALSNPRVCTHCRQLHL